MLDDDTWGPDGPNTWEADDEAQVVRFTDDEECPMPTARLTPKLQTWVEEAIEEVADLPCLYDTVLSVTPEGPVFSIVLYVEHHDDVVEVWSTSRFPSRLTYEEIRDALVTPLWANVTEKLGEHQH